MGKISGLVWSFEDELGFGRERERQGSVLRWTEIQNGTS